MIELYLATKGCSMGLQECLLLAVDKSEGEVRFKSGNTRDRFSLGEDGRPICITERGYGLSYIIRGPLTDEQLSDLSKLDEPNLGYPGAFFINSERRVLSARVFH